VRVERAVVARFDRRGRIEVVTRERTRVRLPIEVWVLAGEPPLRPGQEIELVWDRYGVVKMKARQKNA
jgi:hypothetical protein